MSIPTFNVDESFSDRYRSAYYERGCFIIKGLLPSNELDQVAGFLARLIDLKFPGLQVNDANIVNRASKLLLQAIRLEPKFQSAVYDIMTNSLITTQLSVNDNVLRVIQKILSQSVALHHKKLLLMSPPEERWHLAKWHQDFFYNGGPNNTVTVYAPLQRTNLRNGGLSVALNSHLGGLLQHSDENLETKWHTISDSDINQFPEQVSFHLKFSFNYLWF